MKIADAMNEDLQIQEFVERMLQVAYDTLEENEDLLEEICDDMGLVKPELKWMFKQLGYGEQDGKVAEEVCDDDTGLIWTDWKQEDDNEVITWETGITNTQN